MWLIPLRRRGAAKRWGGLYSLNNQTHPDLSQNHDLEGIFKSAPPEGRRGLIITRDEKFSYKATDITITMTVTLAL